MDYYLNLKSKIDYVIFNCMTYLSELFLNIFVKYKIPFQTYNIPSDQKLTL